MEYNEWADWGQSDWGNGWTTNNTISQNYNSRQPTSKGPGNTNQSTRQNTQSAAGYFDNNSVQEDDWFVQNQTQNIQRQPTYSVESINNNNPINQIENREVAPPDNKQNYDSTKPQQNQYEAPKTRPNQFSAPPPKGLQGRQPAYNSMEPSNISNYFETNQVSQVLPDRTKPNYSQQNDQFHAQVSGNLGSGDHPYQEKFENEPQFFSLGQSNVSSTHHSSNMPYSHLNNKTLQQTECLNVDQQSNEVSKQQNQQISRPNLTSGQRPPGMEQQTPILPLGQQIQKHTPNLSSQKPPSVQNSMNPPLVQNFPPMIRPSYSSQGEKHTSVQQSIASNLQPGQNFGAVQSQSSNFTFDQQMGGVVQQPPIEDQTTALLQHSSALPPEHQSVGINQQMSSISMERLPNATQHAPPTGFGQHHKIVTQPMNVQQVIQTNDEQQAVDPRRFTPSPQRQMSKTSNPLSSQSSYFVGMNTEANETTNQINPLPAFHASNVNIFPPIATSSPLISHKQNLENQEGIPDNKEYPDNTENILQDLKALKISPPRENEQEAQKHCAIDRNQYLETGQFSAQKENTYVQNIEINDEGEAPPPGLHRLVTGQGYEPVKSDPETGQQHGLPGENIPRVGATRQSTPLSSIGGESEGQDGEKDRRREVPGEAEPLQGRVVVGQVPTPPQDSASSNRGERERDRLERMVVGEHGQSGNTSDDYRQSGRPSRHTRHIRNDSSYEEEERDYSSDRDRRNDDHRRRDDRPRRRREHRSPEYRSDEEYEDHRGYHRSGRESRRRRDYSPDRSYYRDYYREDDPRHHRSYYGREYDDVYYRENQRSRPSSRSGSDYRGPMKHSMRVLPSHHYYHDPYVSAPSYHDFNLKYSQRTLEYFERMRHVDPAGYAAWYSQYMQSRLMQESSRTFSSDRASVHSGQSSSNQRHGISTPQEVVDDLTREEEEIDYTPKLYDCAHIKGSMDGNGRLIVVEPNYPLDQQKATVHLCRLSQVSVDKDSEDFFQSPGPFIPGVTHRNTVLQYLKRISDKSTKSSEKLLYDLVYLTVKGNGEVNGSDVAELLMESYKQSNEEEKESSDDGNIPVSRKEVTTRFRDLLIQGNKAEALDWAIDNGAWGHALFLASKMGERTHNDIMLRFANSIPHNDPLQTLYQLMSGYIPQAATCCADKKWSDWRSHLAMILSNPTGNVQLDRQAIITLGDSLKASGRLFASHFCYVTAQVEFSQFQPDSKLVLLGSSHNQEFSKFATCRSIMLTMCYEYGLKLRQPNFCIPSLQIYKLILAARLIDNGRIRSALQYCELLAQETVNGNISKQKSLISTVIDISLRLKMLDPVLALSGNTDKDPEWLASLKQFYDTLPDESVSHNTSPLTLKDNSNDYSLQDVPYQVSDSQHNSIMGPGSGPVSIGVPTYSVLNHVNHAPVPNVPTYQHLNPPGGSGFQPLSQPLHQISSRHQADQPPPEDNYHTSSFMPAPSLSQPPQTSNSLGYLPAQTPDGGSLSMPGSIEVTSGHESWEPRPPPIVQSSSENPQSSRNSFFKATEEQLKLNEVGGERKKDIKQPETKPAVKSEEQSGGWFGGIWDKIALRPKNQMRLPDDNNPSIIWDEKKKRWVNLDGDNENSTSAKPPPKASEALPPQGNKYKIQKGKLMKSNYVDVMGNKDKGDTSSSNLIQSTLPPPVKTNFFIPSPVEGNDNAPIDFITPAPHNPVIAESSSNNNKQQVPGNAPPIYNTSRFPS